MNSRNILALIGILLFALILASIRMDKVLQVLLSINLWTYAIALVLTMLLLVLKGLKWKAVLNGMEKEISLTNAVHFYTIGLFLGNVTPGKVGDFSKALYLKDSVGVASGLASALLDRLIDVGILLLLSAVSALSLLALYNTLLVPLPIVFAACLAFALLLFLLFNEKYLRMILKPFFFHIVPDEIKEKLRVGFADVFSSLKSILPKRLYLSYAVALGALSWFVSALAFYILSLSLSMDIPAQTILLIFPVMSLAEILPISFSGLGTRDAILIFLLSQFAIGAESAVALSLLVLFSGYVLVSFIGFVLFLASPIKIEL